MLSDDELASIEKLLARISKGPWRWGDWNAIFGRPEENRTTLENYPESEFPGHAAICRNAWLTPARILAIEETSDVPDDLEFIAKSREWIPQLVDEIKRLRALLATTSDAHAALGLAEAELRKALADVADHERAEKKITSAWASAADERDLNRREIERLQSEVAQLKRSLAKAKALKGPGSQAGPGRFRGPGTENDRRPVGPPAPRFLPPPNPKGFQC